MHLFSHLQQMKLNHQGLYIQVDINLDTEMFISPVATLKHLIIQLTSVHISKQHALAGADGRINKSCKFTTNLHNERMRTV